MRRRSYFVFCTISLVAGLLCGCQGGDDSSSNHPAREKTPTTIKEKIPTRIILRSILPPDLKEAKKNRVLRYGLTNEDYDRFATISSITQCVPLRIFSQEIRYLESMVDGRVVATTPEYAKVNALHLVAGRFLTAADNQDALNVAVLGSTAAEKLFPSADPLGKSVRLGGHFYQVVGVLASRKPTAGSGDNQGAEDFNADIYIPLNTCKVRFGEKIFIRQGGERIAEQVELHQILITVDDLNQLRVVADVIRDLLKRHHEKQDWELTLQKLPEVERTAK